MKKTLTILPALALASTTPAIAQSTVDKSAANFKEGNFTDYSAILEKLILESADGELPDRLTPKMILDSAGLGNIKTYAQSSTQDGTEWINRYQLNNGGDHKGAFKLLADSKYNDFSVAEMSPAGTDLAVQFGLNLKSAEATISELIANGAPEGEIENFKESMAAQHPVLGVTASETLKKLDFRVNLAIDLDPNEKLPTPIGEIDKPNLVLRLDGISWIWDKVGAMAIEGSGLPFNTSATDGITTFSLPAEMAAGFMGYLPELRVDPAKDQIWLASTPGFLAKCTSGTNTLSSSAAYKATMAGLPTKGQAMTYMSKDFATFLTKIIGDVKAQGILDGADATINAQLDNALAQLGKVNKGAAQVISIDKTGIFTAERGVQNIEEQMAEVHKALEIIKKATADADAQEAAQINKMEAAAEDEAKKKAELKKALDAAHGHSHE